MTGPPLPGRITVRAYLEGIKSQMAVPREWMADQASIR